MSKYNPYIENGYEDRKHYLKCIAEDYNVPLQLVYELATLLGKSEDFDGLISALEDAEHQFNEY